MKKLIATIAASVLVILMVTIVLNITAKEASAETPATSYSYESICIRSGDSLWSIAECALGGDNATDREVRDMVQNIREINNLSSDTIHAGNYLVVPYAQTA